VNARLDKGKGGTMGGDSSDDPRCLSDIHTKGMSMKRIEKARVAVTECEVRGARKIQTRNAERKKM